MSVLESKIVREMVETMSNMYRLGWNERNGGNISCLLNETELDMMLPKKMIKRQIALDFDVAKLMGKYFLVTGSGHYFKNAAKNPEEVLGIVRVGGGGLDLLWGLEDGANPTSELPTHFMSHMARLEQDANHRIIMHSHATHLLAMSFTHSLKEEDFTKTLWKMCTECIIVFPEGIGILPWLMPGSNEIGMETAKKMETCRLVLWPYHGIYGAGCSFDETFGLIETAEKAAQIYSYVRAQGGIKQTISTQELKDLAAVFGVVPRKGVLD
ncbi:MAG: rhamnulose-1-phosphate aldolase [Turicibacter sp.]|nr:rhamnulose-1-phosphate aldolase [Turicibacter sp.]